MYSDNVQHAAARQANDEFLRRLVGGELCRAEKCRPRGAGREASCTRQSEPCNRPQPRGAVCNLRTGREEHPNPPCNQGDECGVPTSHIHAPALAMVYSPVQGWEGLLDPVQALAHGSQFTTLILPLEADKRDGNCGRCQK